MLTPIQMIFYAFAAVAAISALIVITSRNPIRSALALVVTFFAMAGVWMLLEAEFLSLILILVYVGAVMTLFLFVIMMLNITTESKHNGFVRYLPLGIILMLMFAGLIMAAVGPRYFGLNQVPVIANNSELSNTAQLGMVLYTDYVYPFEIAGVILLAAIIAAITLTHRGARARRGQDINTQVSASPKTSLRIIKMASEPRQGN